MPIFRIAALTGLAMIAFAGNLILCRIARRTPASTRPVLHPLVDLWHSCNLDDYDFSALQSKMKGQLILKIKEAQTQLFGYQSDLAIAI